MTHALATALMLLPDPIEPPPTAETPTFNPGDRFTVKETSTVEAYRGKRGTVIRAANMHPTSNVSQAYYVRLDGIAGSPTKLVFAHEIENDRH